MTDIAKEIDRSKVKQRSLFYCFMDLLKLEPLMFVLKELSLSKCN